MFVVDGIARGYIFMNVMILYDTCFYESKQIFAELPSGACKYLRHIALLVLSLLKTLILCGKLFERCPTFFVYVLVASLTTDNYNTASLIICFLLLY